MSLNKKWKPESGEAMLVPFLDYLERDEESGSDEGALEMESVEDKMSERWTPSPLSDFGGPSTGSYSRGPGTEIYSRYPGSELANIGIGQLMSPLDPTSLPTLALAAPSAVHFSRSRSLLSGTSRGSLPWEPREDEDVVFQEDGLEEEGVLELLKDGEGRVLEIVGMPVEMDVVDPAPRLIESVLPRRSSQRGMRPRAVRTRGVRARGVSTQGASSQIRRRPTTYAVSNEREWCRGEPLIEACATEADVPPRLREVKDDLHDRNVRREQQMRRRVLREDDDSDRDYDLDQDREQGMFGGDSAALNFDWSSMETFQGSQEQFLPETTGPVRNFSDAYDAFHAYWNDDILQHIVVETNRYAAAIASHSVQFAREWTDTNVDEIMILFAFWMMLGIHKMPTINSCFSQNPVLRTNLFTRLFTKRRYCLLNRALHFVDNSTRTPHSSRLFSLGPVLEHLKAKFMNLYTPGQDISIDELLMVWKGNLVLRQYVSTKAARFGIKTFELCEAATGYLWAFNVYTGKDTSVASSSSLPKNTKAVLDLVTPLLNKGHRLFMDNWFNSPILARYLKRNGTDCVGMLRKNRRNVPPLIQRATLPKGHFVARHAGDVVVMAYQDRKTVYTISTCHSVDMVQVSARPDRPYHYIPTVVRDYNHGMGGLHKKDQMLEPYLVERKRCVKWSRKLFKRLLNDSVLNSRILLQQSSGDQRQHLDFQVDLVNEIVTRHLSQVPQPRQRQRKCSNKISGLPVERLINVGGHFPVRPGDLSKPLTSGNRTSKNRGNCYWCRVQEKRYSRSVYMCEICGVFLCMSECFKKYHTQAE